VAKLQLSLAVSDYDHVRDLTSGKIPVEGVDLLPLDLEIEEIFHRLLSYGEFDVGELSMGMYTSLVSQGLGDYLAIPVFPIRSFRHSIIYVRTDAGITEPQDLIGKRVGIPQWSQTALTYVRAFLMHDYGLDLSTIRWVQGGVNQAGRIDPVQLALPPGVEIEGVTDRSLNELVLAGELDAVISARAPLAFSSGDSCLRRLFENYQAEEKTYFQRTGVYPIMHCVVVRKTLLNDHPWLARNLYDAFEAARRAGVERAWDTTSSRFALPWAPAYMADAATVLGDDPFAYGIAANRVTLDAWTQYAYEQGVAHRRVPLDDLFARQLNSEYRV
jgi:4,5-dihydroxyphthalate decarboxylase